MRFVYSGLDLLANSNLFLSDTFYDFFEFFIDVELRLLPYQVELLLNRFVGVRVLYSVLHVLDFLELLHYAFRLMTDFANHSVNLLHLVVLVVPEQGTRHADFHLISQADDFQFLIMFSAKIDK